MTQQNFTKNFPKFFGKLLILLLFIIAILIVCFLIWENNDIKQGIIQLEKQIETLQNTTSSEMILFEKQTRCGALGGDIEERIASINAEYADLGDFSVGGLFYSPVHDACLWVRLTKTHAPDGSTMERRALYQYGDDFGATAPIIGCEQILGEEQGVNTCEKYDGELQRLKGKNDENRLNL